MNAVAILVIGVIFVAALFLVIGLFWLNTEKAIECERTRGNLRRMNLSRKLNDDFYSFEDADGSLQWRRISSR